MEVSYELWMWMKEANAVSSGSFIEKDLVKLSESDSERLELGLIMPLIRYSFPEVNSVDLKQVNSGITRLYNWNLWVTPLRSIGVVLSPEIKMLIVAGDRMQVIDILGQIYQQSVKNKMKKVRKATVEGGLLLNNIDLNLDLTKTESLLEFFVLSFCKAFQVSPKVAAGLLAQNYNYLAQVLAKGLKRNFTPVIKWYDIVLNNGGHLVELMKKGSELVKMILDSLQPGLQSKSTEVVEKAAETLIFIFFQLKGFEEQCWEWVSKDKNILLTCFQLLETQPELADSIISLLFTFSQKNLNEMFVILMRDHSKNTLSYINLIQVCLKSIKNLQISNDFFSGGLIEIWVEICLKELEIDAKNLNAKSFYLGFLCDIWCEFSNFFQIQEGISNSILTALKRSSQRKNRFFQLLIFGRMFQVLVLFSKQKNPYAPIIYKTLSFCTLENYSDERIREFMLSNMMGVFDEIITVPIGVLLEPLAKEARSLNAANFTLSDFDFYLSIARHPRLSLKESVILLDLCGKFLLSESPYFGAAEISFLIVVSRFIDTKPTQDYILKFFAFALKKIVKNNEKKLDNLLGLIEKIIRFNHDELNGQIREKLFFNAKFKQKRLKMVRELLFKSVGGYEEVSLVYEDHLVVERSISLTPHRVVSDIENIKQKRLARENKEKDEIKRKNLNELLQKKKLRKEINQRRIELGIESRTTDNKNSVILSEVFSNAEPSKVFMRIEDESEPDQQLIKIVLKKYSRVTKALFQRYSGSGYKSMQMVKSTFEKIQTKKKFVSEADCSIMMKNFGVLQEFLSLEDLKSIYVFLSTKLKSPDLHYDNFPDFLYIIASMIFSKDTHDLSKFPPAIHLQALFDIFFQSENIEIPKSLFTDPDPGYGDKDVIGLLNKRLENDSEFVLPENYVKVQDIGIVIEYKAFCEKKSLNCALEILDEIFYSTFGTHFLMPIILKKTQIKAKAVQNFEGSRAGSIKYLPKIESNPGFARISPNIKIQMVSHSLLPSHYIFECGRLIDDLIFSVEKNSFTLISRFAKPLGTVTNRVIQEKIQQEFEKRNQSERAEKARKSRMQKINEKITQFRVEKEYSDYLKSESTKKQSIVEKFKEVEKRNKNDRKRFELEEKILEYKLMKIESELSRKVSMTPTQDWRSDKKVSTSVDLSRPKSIGRVSTQKSKQISVPRYSKKSPRNY